MTSRKKLRKLLGSALFLSLVISMSSPTSASQTNSSSVADGQETSGAETSNEAEVLTVEQRQGWYKDESTGKWYYYEEDGTQRGEGWLLYQDEWYYLKEDGSMAALEWITYDGSRYYFKSWGGMYHSEFLSLEGKRYYFRSWGGVYVDTAFSVEGKTYHAGEDASLWVGVHEEDGSKYLYDDEGVLLETPGWIKYGGKWYFICEDTSLQIGWLKHDGCWYYLKEDGVMASSEWIEYDNSLYYFRSWGGMYSSCFQKIDGNLYYFQSWGGAYRDTAFRIDGKWYRALADSSLCIGDYKTEEGVTLHYGENGALETPAGWHQEGDLWYYLKEDGTVTTGWLKHDGCWYYLKENGVMASQEWLDYDGSRYYFKNWGGMYSNEFLKKDGSIYYFKSWGGMYRDEVFQAEGKSYRAQEDGSLAVGWYEENEKHYYYNEEGDLHTEGWLKLEDSWYWINGEGYRKEDEMFTYDGNLYYVQPDGVMQSEGWVKWQDNWYYPRSWGGMYRSSFLDYDGSRYYLGDDCIMVTGWQKIGGYTYYFRSWGGMVTGDYEIDGVTYHFDEEGRLIQRETEAKIGVKTVRNYLMNALLPVGNTLYIWGGGHDDSDTTRNGVNPQWKQFFDSQDADYNYNDHRYEHGNGLDCSGFVGWTTYQVMQTESTWQSTETPKQYYYNDWGTYKSGDSSMKFLPGDVVSMSGHVWIVLGQCDDGSIVIVHATPPYIQISGTVAADGSTNSEAIALAKKYMSKYYPEGYERYGVKVASKDYMQDVNHFSWNSATLSDQEGYRDMSAAEVLADLFNE
ncbi:MAG: hypothetical protein SOT28_06530 [Fusicatenibacter sp.]|nr:hypothetical protein [Lachnospiraceae bacterium]MDY2937945.1 hypothetical protein [Fusicatenibacter sp.]